MVRPSTYPSPRGMKRWCLALLLCLAPLPSAAQEPDCDNPPPADLPVPAGGPFTCPNSMSLPCDLELVSSISPGGRYVSDYLRLGDAVGTLDAGGLPAAEIPRFSFDAANNRFYGKLYTKVRNAGSVPALVTSPVTVTLDFKATNDPIDIAGPWTAAGTYTMNIPAGVAPAGALNGGFGTPGDPNPHIQLKPVCWHGPAGGELPRRFMLRARVAWGGSPPPVESSTTNNVAYKFYDLAPPKAVSDVGLVLDLSGSMLETLPSGLDKLTEAKDRARLFVGLVDDGERLGVYGFATGNPANGPSFTASYRDASGATVSATVADTSLIAAPAALTTAARASIQMAISAQTAHGCTPVGQGLLRARAGFATGSEHSKAIVLFSDGLQNVPPFVNQAATWSCGSAAPMPPIDAAKTFAAEDTSIYSIYFGPEVLWSGYALMQELRAQTGGDYVYGAATGSSLALAYMAIRNQLDDLIYLDEHGQTAGPGPGAPFTVHFDTAVRQATVGIAWQVGEKAELTVEGRRQGESTWRRLDVPTLLATHGTTVDTDTGDDAHRVLRFDPGAGSTWELRVVQLAPRQGGVPYVLAVYSDVESARLNVTLGSAGFIAGNPLPIYADLRRAGHAIVGAQVDADVLVPARAPSTVVRGYAGRLNATGTGDAGRVSAVAAQVRRLLAADGQPDLYSFRSVAVSLRDDGVGADTLTGDGIYTGVLAGNETQAAGEVQVTVRARGTTPSGFPFERAAKLETIAAVGPADPERSEVRIDVGQVRPDGTRLATVTVLPTDRFGNAAFPSSGVKTGVNTVVVWPRPGGGTLAGGVEDGLDTTFVQTLVLGPGESPAVDVSVGGVAIGGGGGTTKPPATFYRRQASFHLGLAEPHGRFGNAFDGGPSVALDFVYRFDPSLALRLEAGLSDFDRVAGGGNRRLTHLVSYLQYRRAAGAWSPYFEAGPGLYDLQGSGSASGFAAGVGAYRALRPRWTLDLALHSHRVGGSLDLGFSQLRLGLLYSY